MNAFEKGRLLLLGMFLIWLGCALFIWIKFHWPA